MATLVWFFLFVFLFIGIGFHPGWWQTLGYTVLVFAGFLCLCGLLMAMGITGKAKG